MNFPYYNQQTNTNINQAQQQVPAPQTVSQPINYSNQMMSSAPLFPQPMGNVYSLTTASEIGNVPAGMSMSVGLCLAENVMYIKALQNGSPMLLSYRLVPLEGQPNSESREEDKKINEIFKQYDERFQMIENQIAKIKDKVGGKTEWQL